MTTTPATLTPAEIDAVLARTWETEQVATARAEAYTRYAEEGRALPYIIERYRTQAVEYAAQAQAAREEARPYEAEFARRGGWNRYFLVTNTNGHVHRGMNCSTCFPSTQYGWLIDLADCDEATMVEEWGEKACTVCFPDAPTYAAFHRPSKADQAAKAARDADKAVRDAAKAAKAIVDLDGKALRDNHGSILKTKVAARNEVTNLLGYLGWYGGAEYEPHIRRIVAALRANAPEINLDKSLANAAKKAAKEGAPHASEVAALIKSL